MKKSIALFVTIMFITIIITIIGLLLKNYNSFVKYNNNNYISQNSIIIKNIISNINSISQNINSSQELKKLFVPFSLSNKNGDFRINYFISPVFDRLDINNPKTLSIIKNIAIYYQLKDPEFFVALIKDSIDKDTNETQTSSEIVLEKPFFQNNKIYNKIHFEQIIKYYIKKTDDKTILSIPWEDYIFFGDGKNHILECNLIKPLLAKFIGLEFTELSCKDINTTENNQTIKQFDIIPFQKNKSFWIDIDINYHLNNNQNIKIRYDINKKKVIKIESNPIY